MLPDNKEFNDFWFYKKCDKFLHNIDTFYYSIKLFDDFTKTTSDQNVLSFRNFFKKFENDNFDSLSVLNFGKYSVNVRNGNFANFYNIWLEVPEKFDFFIAHTVPTHSSGQSVTSEIIVQIRSAVLWSKGVNRAYEESFDIIKTILDKFELRIYEVKENRIDFCWHTNYLQNPEQFLRIDNLAEKQVSRYKDIQYHYSFKNNSQYESDYVALGKRGNKCFLRMYLKTKEVVEKGYKSWFFMYWLFNGLISRYDLYVLEKAYLNKSWKYVDIARLEFYIEYGTDDYYKKKCSELINKDIPDYDVISSLAKKLTPEITKIMNIEYQTSRKMTKSYKLLPIKDNSRYGVSKRIYDYLDNRKLITDYLTHSVFRMIDIKSDSNKSRCDYCDFWKRLRNTKQVDVCIPNKNLKLVREYAHNLNKELQKKRTLNSCVMFGIYEKGANEDTVVSDCVQLLNTLNDNDIERLRRYKAKKLKQINLDDFIRDNDIIRNVSIIDEEGVILC